MTKYILELKNRFVLLFITWFFIVLIGYLYKETLLFLFLESEMFVNNEFKVDYFIFTDVIEVFSVYIQLISFISLQILFLYVLYHSFVFLSHGLFIAEYYGLSYIFKTITIIWFLSVIVSKYVLIPTMWNFFLNFQTTSPINLHFEAKLEEYLSFYIQFYYIFIFYSQIFTLLLFFFNYINASFVLIKKFRKIYYYFFVLFSTVVSPPEIFSQILVSSILIFFYELFIFGFILKSSLNSLIRQPIETNKNTYSK
jgi:sec-independent protein translocase protein TatC